MIGEGSEKPERLKDDPRAAALIEAFNRAAGRAEKLAAGLRLAEHLTSAGRNDQAQQALEAVREFIAGDADQAAFMRRQAELLYRQSRYEDAAQVLEQAIVKLGAQPDPMELFHVYRQQAQVYFRQGYLERARSFAEGAQAILQTMNGRLPEPGPGGDAAAAAEDADMAWASIYHVMALLDGASGNHDGAVRFYDQEIDILERLGHEERLGSIYNNISGLLKVKGNMARALDYQMRSYQLATQGGDPLSRAISCNNLAELHFGMGDCDRAEEYYRQYLEFNKRIGNRLGDAFGRAGLGRIAQARGDLAGAAEHFAAALEVAREVKSRSKESSILAEICELHCRRGDLDEAGRALDGAIAICLEVQAFNAQRHQLLSALIKAGQAGKAGEPERSRLLGQARELIEEALAQPFSIEEEEHLTEQDLERQAYHLQAGIRHLEGDAAGAREAATKAWAMVERTLELLPEKNRPLYLGKPEIKELKMLRDSL